MTHALVSSLCQQTNFTPGRIYHGAGPSAWRTILRGGAALYLYRHRQAVFYTLQNHLDVHEAANVSQVALKLPNLCRPPLVQGYRFCLLRQYSADVVRIPLGAFTFRESLT